MVTVVKTKLQLVNRGLSDLSAESVDYRRGEFVSPVGSQGFDWPNSVKRLLDCRL